MILIVAVDDKNGMTFGGRRQSMDSRLRERIIKTVGENKLLMNAYSAKQFTENKKITVDEDFLAAAGKGEYCFLENSDITPFADRVERVILYRWNRVYPSGEKFPIHLFENRWRLTETSDFTGNSHDKITEEIYVL